MPSPRGTGRNLLDAYRLVPSLRPDWEFILYHQRDTDSPTPRGAIAPEPRSACPIAALRSQPNVQTRRIDIPGDRFDLWFQVRLPAAAWRDRVDLLHLPANAAPARCPVPFVVTVHDLIPLTLEGELSRDRRRAFLRGLERALSGAQQVISPSRTTCDELHRKFKVDRNRLTVIPWAADRVIAESAGGVAPTEGSMTPPAGLGADSVASAPRGGRRVAKDLRILRPPQEADATFPGLHSTRQDGHAPPRSLAPAARAAIARVRERYGLDKSWLLNFSGPSRRKNATGLIDAFARVPSNVRRDVQLVLVGCEPASFREELEARCQRLGVRSACRVFGFVPHEDLPGLLSGARGLVMPSLCEGFGLPILDAFACRTPVLTSDLSSMPEVAGDAAVYCDPRDAASIAEGIVRLLEPATGERLRRAGADRLRLFSWEQTARMMCDVYERCVPATTRRVAATSAAIAGASEVHTVNTGE